MSAAQAFRKHSALRGLGRGLLALALLYAAALVFLSVTQEQRIFFPQPMSAEDAAARLPVGIGAREVWRQAPDGTRLHAWWQPAQPGQPSPRTLMYLGGNAEDVHWRLGQAARYPGWNLLLIDYRGYGRSQGQPGQAALQDDALGWFDALQAGVDGLPPQAPIGVMGTSLGSYFATHVAAQRPVAVVVLATPFDSVRDYIQSKLPLVPVRWILRHPLDSLAHAPEVKAPTLFLVAEQDITIPPERARRLFDAWQGQPKTWVLVPQSGHDTAAVQPAYAAALSTFLAAPR